MLAARARRLAFALGAAIAATGAGCGGVRAADLFIVYRSGAAPQARLTLLVNEEGGVTCNGRVAPHLDDPQLVQARALQEELHDPASRNLSLPPRAGSVLSYRVRDVDGSVSFSDNSLAQPAVLRKLALFVLQSAQQVCRLPE